MIANIARTSFPDLYARRLKETQEYGDQLNAVLPIFYCKLNQARHQQTFYLYFHFFWPGVALASYVSTCHLLISVSALLLLLLLLPPTLSQRGSGFFFSMFCLPTLLHFSAASSFSARCNSPKDPPVLPVAIKYKL